MKKYRLSRLTPDGEIDSDIESDGGTHYSVKHQGEYRLSLMTDAVINERHAGILYVAIQAENLTYKVFSYHHQQERTGFIPLSALGCSLAELNTKEHLDQLSPYLTQILRETRRQNVTKNGFLAQGSYCKVRTFGTDKTGKIAKVVLEPVSRPHFKEAINKHQFFKALYPLQAVSLQIFSNAKGPSTYRLVLPKITGVPYAYLHLKTKQYQQLIFASCLHALDSLHQKGYVYVDLKEDNIIFNSNTNMSSLIDGGEARKQGEQLSSGTFVQENAALVAENRAHPDFVHIAPECWDTVRVPAKTSMDIYSLGSMLRRLFKPIDPQLKPLLDLCLNYEPEKRPTLLYLQDQLHAIFVAEEHLRAAENLSGSTATLADESGMKRSREDSGALNDSCKP